MPFNSDPPVETSFSIRISYLSTGLAGGEWFNNDK